MHGYGIYTYPSGNIYKGEWKNNKRHGIGVCHFKDRSTREGTFENDKEIGVSIHTNTDK